MFTGTAAATSSSSPLKSASAVATQLQRWALPPAMLQRRDAVLDFWFRPDKGDWRPSPESPLGAVTPNFDLWFGGAPDLDREITEKFKPDVEAAIRGQYNAWQHESPHSLLALIILLDQFSLNIYRDQPAGYRASELAIPLAYMAECRQWTKQVNPHMAMFYLLPIMHSEKVDDQIYNVNRAPDDTFVKLHADVIFKFGRFVGRNACERRESTAEEKEHLKANPDSF